MADAYGWGVNPPRGLQGATGANAQRLGTKQVAGNFFEADEIEQQPARGGYDNSKRQQGYQQNGGGYAQGHGRNGIQESDPRYASRQPAEGRGFGNHEKEQSPPNRDVQEYARQQYQQPQHQERRQPAYPEEDRRGGRGYADDRSGDYDRYPPNRAAREREGPPPEYGRRPPPREREREEYRDSRREYDDPRDRGGRDRYYRDDDRYDRRGRDYDDDRDYDRRDRRDRDRDYDSPPPRDRGGRGRRRAPKDSDSDEDNFDPKMMKKMFKMMQQMGMGGQPSGPPTNPMMQMMMQMMMGQNPAMGGMGQMPQMMAAMGGASPTANAGADATVHRNGGAAAPEPTRPEPKERGPGDFPFDPLDEAEASKYKRFNTTSTAPTFGEEMRGDWNYSGNSNFKPVTGKPLQTGGGGGGGGGAAPVGDVGEKPAGCARLKINGLNFQSTQEQVEEAIGDAINAWPKDCYLPPDNRGGNANRGFGFIEFNKEEEANKFFLANISIAGRSIRKEWAPKESRGGGGGGGGFGGGGGHRLRDPGEKPDPECLKLKVNGLDKSNGPNDVKRAFAEVGIQEDDITDCFCPKNKETNEYRGFGIITFASTELADKAIATHGTFKVGGNLCSLDWDRPREPRAGGGGGGGGFDGGGGGGGFSGGGGGFSSGGGGGFSSGGDGFGSGGGGGDAWGAGGGGGEKKDDGWGATEEKKEEAGGGGGWGAEPAGDGGGWGADPAPGGNGDSW
uniref:RRM domain-containing protein n=1 Tax=Chromera velia CCMP2878 TaxID=1169474 RepID=A0A0G4H1Q9_9ALVE|eukprot:Cvel_5557.t1-p1 / transcript=Cvel_5557.t1 / gene=Cvel_5557 / organism=Chromera_velia_CCMP2878 / gene_product=hypothetical protein / transcript_product=hypothetical protein / location=Cvel_scaffold261:21482-28698(-) / protein_length=731 / sequence_SO=supercontig / SO=protein_coding / is_pseudo=false